MNNILSYILKNPSLRNLVPYRFRRVIKSFFYMAEYNEAMFKTLNPYSDTPYEWAYSGKSKTRIGILFDTAHYHRYYQSACIDLGVGYQVIDIRRNDWIIQIKESGVKIIVAWPSLTTSVLKEMLDERSRLIKDYLGLTILPNPEEIYLLDNKRRVRDWLYSNKFTPPATWCFFSKTEALDFVKTCPIPIVFKSIKEGVSRGVIICRERDEAFKLVKKCFSSGFVPRNTDPRNNQWDFVLFQEYLPEVEERRMIRIGDSYLAIDKVRKGDFHSGSGQMKWATPDKSFLDATKTITDKGNFKSMNVDFFIAKDGRILVNELHTMFHGPKILENENKGRYLYNKTKNEWEFQPGSYYRNYCCNLRIIEALRQAEIDTPLEMDWINKPAFEYATI